MLLGDVEEDEEVRPMRSEKSLENLWESNPNEGVEEDVNPWSSKSDEDLDLAIEDLEAKVQAELEALDLGDDEEEAQGELEGAFSELESELEEAASEVAAAEEEIEEEAAEIEAEMEVEAEAVGEPEETEPETAEEEELAEESEQEELAEEAEEEEVVEEAELESEQEELEEESELESEQETAEAELQEEMESQAEGEGEELEGQSETAEEETVEEDMGEAETAEAEMESEPEAEEPEQIEEETEIAEETDVSEPELGVDQEELNLYKAVNKKSSSKSTSKKTSSKSSKKSSKKKTVVVEEPEEVEAEAAEEEAAAEIEDEMPAEDEEAVQEAEFEAEESEQVDESEIEEEAVSEESEGMTLEEEELETDLQKAGGEEEEVVEEDESVAAGEEEEEEEREEETEENVEVAEEEDVDQAETEEDASTPTEEPEESEQEPVSEEEEIVSEEEENVDADEEELVSENAEEEENIEETAEEEENTEDVVAEEDEPAETEDNGYGEEAAEEEEEEEDEAKDEEVFEPLEPRADILPMEAPSNADDQYPDDEDLDNAEDQTNDFDRDTEGMSPWDTSSRDLPTLTVRETTKRTDSGLQINSQLEIKCETESFEFMKVTTRVKDASNTESSRVVPWKSTLQISLVPGPNEYEIMLCGIHKGEKCASKSWQGETRQFERIDDPPTYQTKYTIEMEKETLYEIINQGKNIAEMNAVVLFQTKLNAGMSSGMWTCEYQTTRQSLIEFTCLYSMHDPSPLDYQLKSEKERVDLWSKGASSVIVAQQVSDVVPVVSTKQEGGSGWLNPLFLLALAGTGYYVYKNWFAGKSQPKWSTIKQYDEEDMEDTYSEDDRDNPAKEFVRNVLVDLGMPQFSIQKYLKILQDQWISSVEQLGQMSVKDLRSLGFNEALVEEIRRRLDKQTPRKATTAMKLSKTTPSGGFSKPSRKKKTRLLVEPESEEDPDDDDEAWDFDFSD